MIIAMIDSIIDNLSATSKFITKVSDIIILEKKVSRARYYSIWIVPKLSLMKYLHNR